MRCTVLFLLCLLVICGALRADRSGNSAVYSCLCSCETARGHEKTVLQRTESLFPQLYAERERDDLYQALVTANCYVLNLQSRSMCNIIQNMDNMRQNYEQFVKSGVWAITSVKQADQTR